MADTVVVPKKKQLREYMFEVGNSSKGSLGMVVRVQAFNRKQALERANEQLDQMGTVETDALALGLDYCNIYVAGNLKMHHLVPGETADIPSEDAIEDEDKALAR